MVMPRTKQMESRMLDLPDPFLWKERGGVLNVSFTAFRPHHSTNAIALTVLRARRSLVMARGRWGRDVQSGDGVEAGIPSCDARSDWIRLEAIEDELSDPHRVARRCVWRGCGRSTSGGGGKVVRLPFAVIRMRGVEEGVECVISAL